jgi:NADH-quinone oxidoreductase subunit E
VGRYVFQVCGTLSCALCGAEEVIRFLESKLGVRAGQTTPDGKFMYEVVECLGACGSAPVMLFGDRYYGNLTLEQLDHLIDELRERPADEPQRVPQLTGVDTQD